MVLAAQRRDRRAEEELLRRYEPLIQSICARQRRPPGCERQDLAQEARIGLCNAIRAWYPPRGPFPAFAARCVARQVIKALDTAGTRKHQLLSRATPLSCFDHAPSTAPATADGALARTSRRADPVVTVLARERLDGILGVLPSLSVRERAVLAGSLSDKSWRQLADEQGCTAQAIHGLLRRARLKLAKADADGD